MFLRYEIENREPEECLEILSLYKTQKLFYQK